MKLWKVIGMAGLAGVAATGAAVARAERRRRAYGPDEVRARLHERHQLAAGAEASAGAIEPAAFLPPSRPVSDGGAPGRGPAGREISLDEAVELTRTGDLWLFRGRSVPDRAIRAVTNSPVNHVGMAVVLGDLPPLLWHAELGQSLPDLWTGAHHRGVQLHDLRAAVTTWTTRYHQQGWLRQLDGEVTPSMEDALLREIARMDGTPFPAAVALAGRWLRGRVRRRARLETTYCAEVVAGTYQAMGLLTGDRPPNWYDPGRFWSGDRLRLERGASLGTEISVAVEPPAADPSVPGDVPAAGRRSWLRRRRRRRSQPNRVSNR